MLLAAKTKTLAPAPLTGRGTLVLEPIDQTRDPRKVWLYAPALRQLVLQANYGYDLPAPNTDALRTVDQYELFSGPTDRYDWTLLGKREMYVPYNAYRVHGDDVAVERIVGRNHLDSGSVALRTASRLGRGGGAEARREAHLRTSALLSRRGQLAGGGERQLGPDRFSSGARPKRTQ